MHNHHFEWEDQLFLWLITNITMHNHHFEREDQLFLWLITNITMQRSTILNGKINNFYG